jgi:hypothetical protein
MKKLKNNYVIENGDTFRKYCEKCGKETEFIITDCQLEIKYGNSLEVFQKAREMVECICGECSEKGKIIGIQGGTLPS